MVRKVENTSGLKGLIKTKILPVFFCLLSLYTLYTLWANAAQVARRSLELSSTPPSDRCVDFFDKVSEYVSKNENTTTALYDYQASAAIVRLCTDDDSETVIKSIGASYVYDVFESESNNQCSLKNNKAQIIANCWNFSSTLWSPEITKIDGLNCSSIFDYAPAPYGLFWNHGILGYTGNVTNPVTKKQMKAPPCSFTFSRLSYAGGKGLIPQCTKKYVMVLHKASASLTWFLYAVAAIPIAMFIGQCYALYLYTDGVYDPLDDVYLGWALRGVPGALYKGYWVCLKSERGPFPPGELTAKFWIICFVQDCIEGIASPLVSVWGCSLGRFPLSLALLMLKIIKIAADAYFYWCKKDDEHQDADDIVDGAAAVNKQFAPPTTAYQQAYGGDQQVQPPPQSQYSPNEV